LTCLGRLEDLKSILILACLGRLEDLTDLSASCLDIDVDWSGHSNS